MIWLLVLVVYGAIVVFGPGWFEAHEEVTLADLLDNVSGQKYLETCVSVKTGKDEQSPMHAATLNQPLSTFYSYGDRYVKFSVVVPEERPSPEPVDAVAVLMRPKNAKHLPSKHDPVHNKKQLLFNDVCTLLKDNDVGFMLDEVNGIGNQFVQALTDVLWYFDGQCHKFDCRSKHGKVTPVPVMFSKFSKGGEGNKGGYNDWVAKRKKPPQLNRKDIIEHRDRLVTLISHPRLCTGRWKKFRGEVELFVKCLQEYADYLKETLDHSAERHHSLQPLCLPDVNSESHSIPASKKPIKPIYAKLMGRLQGMDYYDPILIDTSLSVTDKFSRYRFFKDLELPYSIHLFVYHAGSQLGNVYYAWKLPDEEKDRCQRKHGLVTAKVRSELPVYTTRAMRKAFSDRYQHVSKLTPAVFRSMYRYLSDDNSLESQTSEIDKRLEMMLLDPDVDLVVDRRELNQGRKSKFEAFWKEVDTLLEDYGKAVDDRRHGPDVAHMPIAISIPDLIKQVAERLPPDSHIPSEPWVRFQFWPRNRFSETAKRYNCRFDVKYKVQSRQLRKSHIDARYCAVLFRYLKVMAVKYRDSAALLFLDDKSKIPVGEPDCPASAVPRNTHALTTSGAILGACDHDFTKFNLTPSVYLVCDIPDDPTLSFYRGQPVVILKDSIFSPSSPYRHMAEFVQLAKKNFSERVVPPIMFFYHDGGPDHRLNYYSVMISYICAFRWLNLDLLVAVQTAPNNSWLNPCERLMSVLNLGLQCVSITRVKGSSESEAILKSCNSMSAIRNEADSNPLLKKAVADSLAPVISLVEKRFQRLSLKEKIFQIGETATSDDIECLWSFADIIDSELSMSNTTKKDIEKTKTFLKFMDSHCHVRKYSFQIKKCDDPTCCPPTRLSREVFNEIKWLPDPTFSSDKAHYKTFQELYGQDTKDTDCPSVTLRQEWEQEPASLFTAAKVRGVALCLACDKPRCLCCEKQTIYKENENLVTLAIESNFYICGSPIFPESHPLSELIRVRTSLLCKSPIERSYYSNKTLKLPPLCVYCGAKDCSVPQEFQLRFKQVLPICGSCNNKKLEPITYMPIKVGVKRKHPGTTA